MFSKASNSSLFFLAKCAIHFCKELDFPITLDNLLPAILTDDCLIKSALASPGSLDKISKSDVTPPISTPIKIDLALIPTPPDVRA